MPWLQTQELCDAGKLLNLSGLPSMYVKQEGQYLVPRDCCEDYVS